MLYSRPLLFICLISDSMYMLHFSGGSDGKESACNAGDLGLTLSRDDPLEKEMATQSSILVWRIPWTEEPGGLQSVGLQSRTQMSN